MSNRTILVAGATGNVGRHVVSLLAGAGMHVRALTRNPETAGLPHGVEIVRGDLTRPEGLRRHLEGVEALFLLLRPATAESAGPFIEMARHARRIVFVSSAAVRDGVARQTNPVGEIHARIENIVRRSGLEWTILRPGGFASNALVWWGPQIRAGNAVRWPYGAAGTAPIHERDIAAVAVRALTEAGHAGATYFLTGPEALTQSEQVRTIGEAIGRPLRFEEIPPDEAREQMATVMPPLIAEVLLETLPALATHPQPVSPVFTGITGMPGRTFREWAADHAPEFRPVSAAA